MSYAWITFRSVTFAERVKKACEQSRIRCSVRQTPTAISQNGCSYGLRCDQRDLPAVLSIAKDNAIPIKGIYEETISQSGEVVYNSHDLP